MTYLEKHRKISKSITIKPIIPTIMETFLRRYLQEQTYTHSHFGLRKILLCHGKFYSLLACIVLRDQLLTSLPTLYLLGSEVDLPYIHVASSLAVKCSSYYYCLFGELNLLTSKFLLEELIHRSIVLSCLDYCPCRTDII